jgi:hypothetical protein
MTIFMRRISQTGAEIMRQHHVGTLEEIEKLFLFNSDLQDLAHNIIFRKRNELLLIR